MHVGGEKTGEMKSIRYFFFQSACVDRQKKLNGKLTGLRENQFYEEQTIKVLINRTRKSKLIDCRSLLFLI